MNIALYVVAFLEQLEATHVRRPNLAWGEWFNVKFAQQANIMNLLTWEQVREPLLAILYTDVLKPHGSAWFQTTMLKNALQQTKADMIHEASIGAPMNREPVL